ncbi:MAG TPA: DUF5615 family PIN-like protein [Gemmataceae bacterium]|nr:DUF5615 family PIN-like protein [Gemmataceae bacterium]
MSTICYLCDENVPEQLMDAMIQREPAIEISIVGQDMAPPKGTLDPEVLLFAEKEKMGLITLDKKSMARHAANHLATGHHTWGVYNLRRDFPILRYVENLILIWSASDAEDWRDRMEWLPW